MERAKGTKLSSLIVRRRSKIPIIINRYGSPLSFLVQRCVPQSVSNCGTKRGTDGMGRLSDRSVKTVGEGRHGDGDGLQLMVSASGRRKWVLRYQLNGVRRDMGLGPYPAIGLSDARIAAADARKLIARGVDPLDDRKASRKAERPVPTFGDIAKTVIADAQTKSSNAKVRYQWERHLGPAY